MANKVWTHLKLKNGDRVQFAPPAPDGDLLGGISAAEKSKFNSTAASIAEPYDSTKTYEDGDFAMFDGVLKAYDGSVWSETTIAENLDGGSGLPPVEGSGKALVSVNGEWVEQEGYGYATQAELLTGTITWGYGLFDTVLDLVLGAKYAVSYDGNTYSDLLCHEYDGKNIIGDEHVYEGSAYEGDLEYPFVTDGYEIYARNVEGEVEVVIYGPVFSQMNINYLPNNNVRNGEGEYSVCEGGGTVASGDYAHAEGHDAEASGFCSHAEGVSDASGDYSHAEGSSNASGQYSHAEGEYTEADGNHSHAEGKSTEANGNYSHSEGIGTIANGDSSHVEGKYNIADTQNKYAHIIGNGSGSSTSKRHNALMVGWDGSITVQSADDTTKMMELVVNHDGSIITKDGTTSYAINAYRKYTTGNSFTLETNAEYYLTDITSLTITYPASGNYNGLFRITFAASGTITVSLPNSTLWIGDKPVFANGETWELSIKDGIAVAGKAVAG